MAATPAKSLILPFQALFREALCLTENIYNVLKLTFYDGSHMTRGIVLVKVILGGLHTELTHT
jgi:hypothetical protein